VNRAAKFLNRFALCRRTVTGNAGNPVNGTDPSGQFTVGEMMAAAAAVMVLSTISCTRSSPAQQRVTVFRYAYEQIEFGVHIVLGAKTLMRQPHYGEYRWVQTVTTNATEATHADMLSRTCLFSILSLMMMTNRILKLMLNCQGFSHKPIQMRGTHVQSNSGIVYCSPLWSGRRC
jgi:hypothetical protein